MWSDEKMLLLSSPNGGGMAIFDQRHWHVIDRVSTTGIGSDDEFFVRSVQQEDHADLVVQHLSGRTRRLRFGEFSDIHDVYVKNGFIYAVSTGTNEIVCLSARSGEIVSRRTFPGEPDSMHLNCLDEWNDRLVVSAFGRFAKHREYKGSAPLNGLVMDVQTGEDVWGQLTEPHSPRQAGAYYLICDSGTGRLLISDGAEVRAEIPLGGYPRGIAITDEIVAIGISGHRRQEDAGIARVRTIDLRTLQLVNEIPVPFREIYDLRFIPVSLATQLKPVRGGWPDVR
ncbi:acetolactate synthase-1/2/3 large subunit [Paenibacillus methanolicus]|uniref:Acetolactate synthase-1/2/3 large subunit n=2 Tax=Paenibacillus methanolicus TaxID=582686 RepID=A0A5S5CAN1_9BACL|nr:acetolactate synthase-1/2/3 large subunit [Paenibacillus methanolicus]